MINTITIMHEELSIRKPTDTGRFGDAFELAMRSYISRRRCTKVKRQGAEDIRFSKDGKRYTCEVKSACGEIEDAEKAQYVIYCPNVDPDFPAESQAYVFTREQWVAFLNGYTGRGQFTKWDSRGHLHIQSFYVSEDVRPKASKPIAAYIESVLFDLPTADEFFERG